MVHSIVVIHRCFFVILNLKLNVVNAYMNVYVNVV